MLFRAQLRRFDAFTKTVEDAKIKTAGGGLISIISAVIVFVIVFLEWKNYQRIVVQPEIVVDPSRNERMEINFNITFPHVPCHYMGVDVMDISGDFQQDVQHSVTKTRLDKYGNIIAVIDSDIGSATDESAMDKDGEVTCGDCYGAGDAAPPETPGCCNNCKAVRDAYARKQWAIGDYDAFQQCRDENYKAEHASQKGEGCNIAGHLFVNRVAGNFHFAPGRSFQTQQGHLHDLRGYEEEQEAHDMTHMIHQLSFGPPIKPSAEHTDPLDGHFKNTDDALHNYAYFIKCVAHKFVPLDPADPTINTNEFSVTQHERSVTGGRENDNPSHLNRRGGIPGVFFNIDISPMLVIQRQIRGNTFGGFISNVLSFLGGFITLTTLVDRGLYAAELKMKKN
ncbi:COPII-coated vesicle component Erv46 [Schizosaccharomyces japonicus yFS275]|uniref:Endoplasmic reticulum-Golgi intermediate compartment protein n=1 Tax=Schizosaccharomyces japonicus (strain yFS275 / FY16936) TaxID=402676 RepID=B6K786_SCHJY|nr:COPII-coated vesicle component Erv46 [Schizosaccharomyces japonicus yFS275]EEB09390.1 COPII-coated vesicle component Erv46 [Schizosaccharomyces japonicus yFS275]